MSAAEDAPRDPIRLLERRHCLAEIVERGGDVLRTARRVLGGAHPDVVGIERELRLARAALHASETPSSQ